MDQHTAAQLLHSPVRLHGLLRLWGVVGVALSALLAVRLVWEQTFLTWRLGPQMVGFSLVHGPGLVLLLGPLLLIPWVLAVAALSIFQAAKRRPINWKRWASLGLAAATLGVLLLPYGFWQWLFVKRIARSPHAGEMLVYAASVGDIHVVKGLISSGVPVDSTNREGMTPLHAAAETGEQHVLEYLVLNHANVNAIDLYGDSPLELADSSLHERAAKFLADHGAKRVRGTDEQRQKAVDEIVGGGR